MKNTVSNKQEWRKRDEDTKGIKEKKNSLSATSFMDGALALT
jgi:hypothetical protein